ncbi:hypothetical protein [Kitasatospora sp. NPDC088783]|uniref:hypothetical protein n=1 Tax=Kitasatospora sp. NPDC088783 TaxID=3364077 RepID=UPI0037F25EE0
MKSLRSAVVVGTGVLVVAGALPLQSAAADQPHIYLSYAQCDQPINTWFDWQKQPLQVKAGEDAGALCRVEFGADQRGAKNVKLALTLSAQSVADSGYSAQQLAQRLSVRSFYSTAAATDRRAGRAWVVNDDGSLTLDLPAHDFPAGGTSGSPDGLGVVDLEISGAPSAKSVLLQGRLDLTADGTTEKLTKPISINYVGNGGSVDLGAPSTLVPVSPARLLDTRAGIGAAKGKLGPDGTLTLTVAGRGGVPLTGVSAVVLNVTATNPTDASHVTAYPHGRNRPTASNLNFTPGETVPNQVTVPVVDGRIDLYNQLGTVDLIADVSGYYTPGDAGSRYTALATPARLLDTRAGTGAAKAKLGADSTLTLAVAGRGGVPAEGVTAVILNVTATNPTDESHVTAYPHGTGRPTASNLNFTPRETISNQVVVPVVDGRIDLYNHTGTVDLVADVSGYFSASGAVFVPTGPARALDTRDGTGGIQGKVGPRAIALTVGRWENGVPPYGITGVALNVTVTNTTDSSFLAVYGATPGGPIPDTSSLNFSAGQTIANAVTPNAADGVVFANHVGSTDVIADVSGYFTTG